MGSSAGCVAYHDQLQQWRDAYILAPEFFNSELFEATRVTSLVGDDWDDIVDKLRDDFTKHRDHEFSTVGQVQVEVSINYDGVSIRESCAQYPQMSPVLGCVTGLRKGEDHFKFSHRMPNFIVGYYIGSKKPDADVILKHVVEEFIHHHPWTCSTPVAVAFAHGIADAPARAEMTGTTGATGYFGLPRCTQEGIHVDKEGEQVPPPKPRRHGPHVKTTSKTKTYVRFVELDCTPRYGHHWDRYKIRKKKGSVSGFINCIF